MTLLMQNGSGIDMNANRGSIHCHGTAKLNNDPRLCELTEIALEGFLAQQSQIETTCESSDKVDCTTEAGKKAAGTACQYVDWQYQQ